MNTDHLRPQFPGHGLQNGFTLAELAIVLLIVALLAGAMLVPLTAQIDQRNASEVRRNLSEIREALFGFAASHPANDGRPYLPCPDTDNDGMENRSGVACTAQEGNVPWATLGVGESDAWNNRFRYRVDAAFSHSDVGFTLATTSNLRVCSVAGCVAGSILASSLPAVFLSHGKNGAGATNSSGGANPAPGTSRTDELANTDANNDFVSHALTAAGSASGEFDDEVAWLPASILFGRMIAAGRLP